MKTPIARVGGHGTITGQIRKEDIQEFNILCCSHSLVLVVNETAVSYKEKGFIFLSSSEIVCVFLGVNIVLGNPYKNMLQLKS